MGPIFRHEPEAVAPADGMYVLVGHFGEGTNFAVWCDKGERLPAVQIAADIGPLWFVHVSETNETARVA